MIKDLLFAVQNAAKTKISNANLPASTPKNPRGSDSFVGRVPNTPEGYSIIRQISDSIKVANKMHSETDRRIRIIKRGRKPIDGSKYAWGGTLVLSKAREIDVYVAIEYVY